MQPGAPSSSSSRYYSVPASSRNAATHPAQQSAGIAGDGDATDSNVDESTPQTGDREPGQTEPMPFPGPFAHDSVPEVVVRFGSADSAAAPSAHTTAGVTNASSTSTTPAPGANAPASSACSAATHTEHGGQPPLPEVTEPNPDGFALPNPLGLPPLLLAARHGKLDWLRSLLEQPAADINQVRSRAGSTALMQAAAFGHLDVVEFLLAMGAEVNYGKPGEGSTALIWASEFGHAGIVQALLNAGADVNATTHGEQPRSALIFACSNGRLEVVNVLVKHPGILLEQTDFQGFNALGTASSLGYAGIVKSLLDAGADVHSRHVKSGDSALTIACGKNKPEVVNVLLNHRGILLEQTDFQGANALAMASYEGYAGIVKSLLKAGADVNFRSEAKASALVCACGNGKLEVVNELLKHPGILLDQTDSTSATALIVASGKGHADIVECLLKAGANVNARSGTANGSSALIAAAFSGHLEMVKILLKHPDIRIEQSGSDRARAFFLAAVKGHASIAEYLLEAGVDINYVDPESGQTALLSASAQGWLETVNVLLKRRGIGIEQPGYSGRTAFWWASHEGRVDVVDRLIEAGANMTSLDAFGLGAMHNAITKGHVNVVECLLKHGLALPNPLPIPPASFQHADCLSDLYLDQGTPAASADNPLRLLNPRLLDDPNSFFQVLVDAPNHDASGNVTEALSGWLAAQGIRQTVIAPMLRSLVDLPRVWSVLAAPGQGLPTARQKLVYCVCTMSRLVMHAPDSQIAAPYRQASLSAAGVKALSQPAIAQRDKLVALAEIVTAQLAADMLNQLAHDCLVKTGVDLRVDADALKVRLINAGFVAPLASLLINSWQAALVQLAATPLAMPQTQSVTEMTTFLYGHLANEGLRLLVREILRQLDAPDLLTQWRATLGDTSTEGLFALFDDQCRQLREYCKQMSKRGE